MKKVNVVLSVALTALCGATGAAVAAPMVPSHTDRDALVQKADYRCYWRYGHKVCRQVDYYRDYDYGYGPGIGFGFGFGHHHHHHR